MDVLVIPLLTGCEDFPDDDLGHDGDDEEEEVLSRTTCQLRQWEMIDRCLPQATNVPAPVLQDEASNQDSPDDKDQMANQPKVETYPRNPGGDQPRKEDQGQQMPTSAAALARYSTNPGGDQPNKFAMKCKEVQWPVTTPVTDSTLQMTSPVTSPDILVRSCIKARTRWILPRPDYREETRPEPTSVRYSSSSCCWRHLGVNHPTALLHKPMVCPTRCQLQGLLHLAAWLPQCAVFALLLHFAATLKSSITVSLLHEEPAQTLTSDSCSDN